MAERASIRHEFASPTRQEKPPSVKFSTSGGETARSGVPLQPPAGGAAAPPAAARGAASSVGSAWGGRGQGGPSGRDRGAPGLGRVRAPGSGPLKDRSRKLAQSLG